MLSAQRGACPGQPAGVFCYHCFSASSPQLSSIPIANPCWLPKRFPCSVSNALANPLWFSTACVNTR